MLRVSDRAPSVTSSRATLDDLMAYIVRPAWHRLALCRHPEYRKLSWLPLQGEGVTAQKAVCGRCAVRAECLAAGIDGDELGIWGGTSGRERLRITKALRATAA